MKIFNVFAVFLFIFGCQNDRKSSVTDKSVFTEWISSSGQYQVAFFMNGTFTELITDSISLHVEGTINHTDSILCRNEIGLLATDTSVQSFYYSASDMTYSISNDSLLIQEIAILTPISHSGSQLHGTWVDTVVTVHKKSPIGFYTSGDEVWTYNFLNDDSSMSLIRANFQTPDTLIGRYSYDGNTLIFLDSLIVHVTFSNNKMRWIYSNTEKWLERVNQ